ncbi:hypothetical protein BIW11_08529 [Tropilaelaps mercedesae]|uniref:CUE domain-containing protein n=1 Tax=Tropilaelaps mercedesae TaxID=418985 RepID=A0A1V9XP67_9ACAR|nr:hypothetical protein BIW11_08529 [Tropilaelaps mercedesae]
MPNEFRRSKGSKRPTKGREKMSSRSAVATTMIVAAPAAAVEPRLPRRRGRPPRGAMTSNTGSGVEQDLPPSKGQTVNGRTSMTRAIARKRLSRMNATKPLAIDLSRDDKRTDLVEVHDEIGKSERLAEVDGDENKEGGKRATYGEAKHENEETGKVRGETVEISDGARRKRGRPKKTGNCANTKKTRTTGLKKRRPTIDNNVIEERIGKLKNLFEQFPDQDIVVLQDVLFNTDWDVQAAKDVVQNDRY